MSYFKIVSYLLAAASLFSSCELFGGGGGDGDEVAPGEVVWKVTNQQELTVGTQPVIDAGKTYIIQDAHLKAYTLAEGTQLWSTQICDLGRNCDYSRAIPYSDELLFVDQGFNITAIGRGDGAVAWNTKITEDAQEVSGIGFPIMSQDETYLYAGRKGYVVKVRKQDGEIVGRYPLDRLVPEGVLQGSTESVISPFGDDILYVQASYFDHSASTRQEASGGNIFAYNSVSGELIWEHQITVTVPDYSTQAPDDSLTGSPLIYDISVTPDKVVVLAGFYIVALDRMTGEPLWKTYFSEGGFDVGLAVEDQGVYAASVGAFATKLDLNTGEKVWQRDIHFSNTSIPTVRNGRLYFNNSGGGGIWVLNTADGSVIYNQEPPGYDRDSYDVYISSLGVGEGYMVNVGSKAVYCLKVP